MIITKAQVKVKLFDLLGLHYNLVADSIYQYRSKIKDPISDINCSALIDKRCSNKRPNYFLKAR